MLHLFKPLFKLLKPEWMDTDNLVFKMHYKVTVPLFLLFSAMLTCKQYFGEPIECYSKGIPDHIMNSYCWLHGTYTVKDLEHVTRRPPTAEEIEYMRFYDHPGYIHPGIRTSDPRVNTRQYHVFYQWVSFLLFIQGVTFFLPRFLWTSFGEGGRMAFLTSGLLDLTADEEEVKWRLEKLLAGFQKVRGRNTKYALVFALFEILNLVNVIVQIYITDLFLHGKFLDYGSRLLAYYQQYDVAWDPMDDVFPKVTKCQFNRHGMGGGIQNHDALCLLPLNVVNEKAYLILWLWLIPLTVASALAVFLRVLDLLIPELRTLGLMRSHHRWARLARITNRMPYGDWFMLRQMAKNVELELFDRFLDDLIEPQMEFPAKEKDIPDGCSFYKSSA